MRERLIDLMQEGDFKSGCAANEVDLGFIADYLLNNGVIVPPCKVGDTVYVVTTCEDFGKVLDGTLWGENGGFGTATGYYCSYELSDSCPHEDGFEECEGGCKCFENKLAVFEDCVESITIYEHETVVFLINCGSVGFEDFAKTVFLTKEEAIAKLAELKGTE